MFSRPAVCVFFGDIYRLFFWDRDFVFKMVDLYRYLCCWCVGVDAFCEFFVNGQKKMIGSHG